MFGLRNIAAEFLKFDRRIREGLKPALNLKHYLDTGDSVFENRPLHVSYKKPTTDIFWCMLRCMVW